MGIDERLREEVVVLKDDHGALITYQRNSDGPEAADLIERLRGYAVHALTCDLANYGGAAECTCGLTALIKEIEGD